MTLLSTLYGAGVGWRNRQYDSGKIKSRRLIGPVVSVGSISAGGAGKTPFLILLGQLLKERGVSFDVLSRGYGRETKGVRLVDPAGTAEEFGDEPLLIAHRLEVPVVVGEDRFAAGKFAEQKFGSQLHLLDDGFQHRRLARDFDIVLLTEKELGDSLLPSGRLREPLSSLSRASAIVLMNLDFTERVPRRPDQFLWRVTRTISTPHTDNTCLAFCGIARPQAFFGDLTGTGIRIVGTRVFRDHHHYSEWDVESLYKQAQELGAQAFVTTEKDAINLGGFSGRLRPLHVASVEMRFEAVEGEAPVDQLCEALLRNSETTVRE